MVIRWKSYLPILAVLVAGCGSEEETENRGQKSEYRKQNTGDRIQKTEYRTQKTETKKVKHPERQEARDFTLPDLKGENWTLSSLKGKVIILDFWATWCAPCRIEIPYLIELYNKYRDDGLIVCGVGIDRKPAIASFSREYGINYPILIGTQQIARQWGIRAIPTTYILDKDGRIAFKHMGFRPGMEIKFEEEIKELLKE